MQSDTFAERILRFVESEGYKPRQVQELARAMGIGEREHGDFHAACKALMKSGRVVLGSQNALMLPSPVGKVVGTYRANPRGFGFIIPDAPNAHGDLYVPGRKTLGAITGDRVCAKVKKRGKRGGKMLYEGEIVEVLSRGRSQFVGELHHQFSRWFVVPDGNTLHMPIVVSDPGAKKAKPGDQVVVEIIQYPDGRKEARGVIVKVLGKRGHPGVDTLSIIEQYGLPGEFAGKVLEEARASAGSYEPRRAAKEREDLRHLTIVTIDPADARDFDDAISICKNADGTTELGVHIADVASFVVEGMQLDSEARERATSVYLPDKVIPMLPEVLSNGVCSLQERQLRLTKSVFITYDKRGKVKRTRFANTMIKSTKRLTYDQVTKILGGKTGRTSAKVVALLKEMEKLAKLIRQRRLGEGMLVLDLPEVELVFDDDGAVADAVPADTSFSHTIIEMFMVEANEAVARLLVDQDVPNLRRIHDEPGAIAGDNLRRFLGALGLDLPKKVDRSALQALLNRVGSKGEAFAVNFAVLRSMQQAEYSPALIGHYALASEHYCHFTSPIRRYPDLTVHRLLDSYIAGVFDDRESMCEQVPTEEDAAALGRHCSANERRAEAAERELRLVLVLRFLDKHLGEEFGGIVTGVANVGVFVQLDRFLIEGLLRFDNLLDDWWEVDSSRGAVIGQRSGHQIRVGDRLQVVISNVHIPTRELELALAEQLKTGKGTSRSRDKRIRRRKTGRSPVARRKSPLKRRTPGRRRQPRRR
ncbi:MAG: ribonuclease R [Phycisphaerales bacterium]|nr:MAG: ribonuclease R [Phycisphaerales bacterium]